MSGKTAKNTRARVAELETAVELLRVQLEGLSRTCHHFFNRQEVSDENDQDLDTDSSDESQPGV